ncbi:MAG: acyl-CoA dehydrogenase family protein [Planctomycetaceae bacterium]|nr:acyl-CoA dehydrogenase family protein [Planctomycetaceae bacterium]
MDFSWDRETLAKVAAMEAFARQNLGRNVAADEQQLRFPREDWDRCAEYGILGLNIPTQFGGSGLDDLTTVRLLEAFGYGCVDTGLTFAVSSQMLSIQQAILHFGSEEQKLQYLSRLTRGQCGAFGITEVDAGSDAFTLQTRAERTGDGYLLNGTKRFITLAPEADLALVFANTSPAAGRWGVSAFIVERGTTGFSTTATQPKMGLRTTPIGDMMFENCFVPEQNRLGAEGIGSTIFTTAMHAERGFIMAGQLGTQQRQLEETIDYARRRTQSGQPIGRFQAVSHRIARMKLRLELCRLILYKVAWLKTKGESPLMEASLAKLYMSEAFVESSVDAVRTFGARGYLSEFEVERDLRDSIGGLIYSGTTDIQHNIIASLLGL